MLQDIDHAALLAFATRLVGRDQAEDFVQATYVRLLETTSTFNGTAQYQTYACRVLKNLVIDSWRSAKPAQDMAPQDEPSATPDYVLALDLAALDLTADERAVLALADESQAEAARTLGWGGKKNQRLVRARRSLRRKLEAIR